MKRGDIYFARLDPTEGSEQGGDRPVVVVSGSELNEAVGRAVVVPLTSYRGRPIHPSQVFVPSSAPGVTRDSIALCEQVRVLSQARLLRLLGALPDALMPEVDAALRNVLELDEG
jgi:mRNA interferase MazF